MKIQRKGWKGKWKWRGKTGRLGTGLGEGIYGYVLFESGGRTVGSNRNIGGVVREVSKRIFGTSRLKPHAALLIVDSMIRTVAFQMWRLEKRGARRYADEKHLLLENTYRRLLEIRRNIIRSVFPIDGATYLPYSLFHVACSWITGFSDESDVRKVLRRILDDPKLRYVVNVRFIHLKSGSMEDSWLEGEL